MKKINIAIDGFSSCGKSSTAKVVAKNLGYAYIDTGAMYRGITLYFLEHYINFTDPHGVHEALQKIELKFVPNLQTNQSEIFLNGLNVEEEIRKMYIAEKVSEVAAIVEVRRNMVAQQQRMGKKRGVVMDGRDIGTMVFPDAELKIFMSADVVIRAERRQKELFEKNELVELDKVIDNLKHRDHIDTTRTEGPLRKATDALELDTTFITFDEQVDIIMGLALSKIYLD
ncbi:MAG: (d)CMP kinase [Bacteroidetes bacterium]|nr:MAG: (d)CMP kinase [Bacteroidota bacterium]